ncbi:FAEL299Wp [Eremothecium gossypii FDAG1]|nr:FAEL299Wp [Eremothecium gossypii FDAG1]
MNSTRYDPVDSDDILFSADDDGFDAAEHVATGTSMSAGDPQLGGGLFNTLAPYYAVTSEQLFHKTRSSLMLQKVQTLEMGNAATEIYSTVWIILSASIALYVSRGLRTVLSEILRGQEDGGSHGQYQILVHVLWLFATYVVAVPLVFKLVVQYAFSEALHGLELVQWYGFGCLVWIPLTPISLVLGLLPEGWAGLAHLILAIAGGAYSFMVMYIQLKDDLSELSRGRAVMAMMAVMHLVFVLLIKLLIL